MNITTQDLDKVFAIIGDYEPKIDREAKIPLDEYPRRWERVWDQLKVREIDFGFFFWYREMPGDGVYLTGYNPSLERACAVIAPGKAPMLLTGPESGIAAKEIGLDLRTEYVYEMSIPDEYYEGVERVNMKDVIEDYAGPIKKAAYLTGDDILPAKFLRFLETAFGDIEVVDASDILEDLRYEKSENELACMRYADIIASACIRGMLAIAKVGIRETELAAVGDFICKSLGGVGYGFETIVNAGHHCTTVIGPATNRVIQEGDIVQIGISPCFAEYKGVCRRAFVMGKRSPIQEEFFSVMNEGYERASAALHNVCEHGLATNQIDLAPRMFFDTVEVDGVNMKSLHLYSTCHGTGLTECNEKMVITPTKTTPYGENVGIMLDLGVYGHPNDAICGGVVEDAYLKHGNSVEKVTDVPIDVQSLVGRGL